MLLGVLLCIAALAKLTSGGLQFIPGWQVPMPLLAMLIQVEAILGLWLLSGLWGRQAKVFAIMLFGLFLAANLLAISRGVESCECFGRFGQNPWISLGIDLVALVLLSLTRPTPTAVPIEFLSVPFCLAIIAGGAIAFPLWFASQPAEPIDFLRSEIDVEATAPGEWHATTITVVNNADRPVRIVGATDSCSCMVSKDVPTLIPARSRKALGVRFLAPQTARTLEYVNRFYTDVDTQYETFARIAVHFHKVQGSAKGVEVPESED